MARAQHANRDRTDATASRAATYAHFAKWDLVTAGIMPVAYT